MRRGPKPRKGIREIKGISKAIIENDDSSDDGGNSPATSGGISKKIPKVNIMIKINVMVDFLFLVHIVEDRIVY